MTRPRRVDNPILLLVGSYLLILFGVSLGLYWLSGCGPSARELCERGHGLWNEVNCREVDHQVCTRLYFDEQQVLYVDSCWPTTTTECGHECRDVLPEAM